MMQETKSRAYSHARQGWYEDHPSLKKAIFILFIIIVSIGSFYYYRDYSMKQSEPEIKMVSGTEYISGEEGQIIVRLGDYIGQPITDARCRVSLLYPDKSFFFIDRNMSQTTVPGNYYVSFTTPEREGIYEEHIQCEVIRNEKVREMHISSSFHVSTGLNMVMEMSRTQREQYEELLRRMNETETALQGRVDNISTRIEMLENNFNRTTAEMDARINESMNEEFRGLSRKFAESYIVMSEIFAE